ncbi:MAG: DEAD/DEAH box helicase, partial [Clostridiales bacterium]|nr:DEAD/DEAH box helicase [Clostridiales bacterium]
CSSDLGVPGGQIGEYSGERKEIRPITITTYQTLTQRRDKESPFVHFEVFNRRNWGLVVYDEVHMLPAPVFRATSEIQSKRRLGLTATLVREDGLEGDVFSLIGSKKYDLPWKTLEKTGYIAAANCVEVRVPLLGEDRRAYAVATKRDKYRVAAENPNKLVALETLLERHKGDHVLIIGQFLDQLKRINGRIGAPIITGATKSVERERLYGAFRDGEIDVIIVSKVANFAIDLPDANVAVEVSGMYGSRQEEAQRLGRILRPKPNDNQAWFYTIVSEDTSEMEFAAKRQMFLTEQGYRYDIQKGGAKP